MQPLDPNGWGAVTGQPQPAAGPRTAQPGFEVSTLPVPFGQSWYFGWAQVAGPPTQDDREKAFLAHLFPAVASVLCLGFALHLIGPLFARTMTRSKHPFLLFHVNQSLAFHGALFVINVVLLVVFYVVGMLTCGIGWLLLSINVVIPLISAGYGFLLAFRAREGRWDKYPIVGEQVWRANRPLIS